MKKKVERLRFIAKYIRENDSPVDILNAEFVSAYIQATGAAHGIQFFGAHSCPQLGRDLGNMYRDGKLNRSRIGVSGQESGFPKWVYCYELWPHGGKGE